MRNITRVTVVLAALLLGTNLSPARAEQPIGPRSLQWVPADACVYEAILGNRQWVKDVFESKAWKRFLDVPMARALWDRTNQGEPIRHSWPEGLGWLADLYRVSGLRKNKELDTFIEDLLGDEVFFFGGDSWKPWLTALDDLVVHHLLPIRMEATRGRDGTHAVFFGVGFGRGKRQWETMIASLVAARDLNTPDLLIGFEVGDPNAAQKRLDRLLRLMKRRLKDLPHLHPKATTIAGCLFYRLDLKGDKIAWDELPVSDAIRDNMNWEKLTSRLRKLDITLALGIREGYLLVSAGRSTRALEDFGKKPRLIDRPELGPLARNLGRRFTSISYASAATRRALDPDKKAIEQTFGWLLGLLKQADLPAELISRLDKDLKSVSQDLREFLIEPGGLLSFTYNTRLGTETYTYDWAKDPALKETRTLDVLEHVGGEPLILCAGRTYDRQKKYRALTRWLKLVHGYVEDLVLPTLDDGNREHYEKAMRKGLPPLGRLDSATKDMLLPALADGQYACVVDAHLQSRKWHRDMPKADRPMRMLEPAFVVSVSDARLLRKAFQTYRSAGSELLALSDEESELEIPQPKLRKVKAGLLLSYPLPAEYGLDPQILPTAGLNDRFAVLAVSKNHARRLLVRTPLKLDSQLLTQVKQPILGIFHMNMTGLIDASMPWINLALRNSDLDNESARQAEEILKILRVFRSYSVVTYAEQGALVTRVEMVVKDLE
jgi:hypothetical protein